jgi:hypothetical protein
VITNIGGMQLSHDHALMMMRAEREDLADARAREQAAEEWREQAVLRAQAYYREHGEWEWQTMERQQAVLARAEAREEEKRQTERVERHQAQVAQLIMDGRRPRTVAEVLSIAAMMP